MQRSLHRIAIIACIGLAASVASVVRDAVATVGYQLRILRDTAVSFLLSVPAAFAENDRAWRATHGPAVALIRAREFYRRFIERETPCVRPTWRACPST